MTEAQTERTYRLRLKSINLHLHSRYSDGALKPKAIIETAIQNNLDLISITDHDTVEAYKHIPALHVPLRIIPGIEFSSTWDDSDVHVLGYGIDVNNANLLEVLSWMKDGRWNRAEKMLDKLSRLGIKIPMETVVSYAGDMNLIVRPHIAQALVADNHCRNKQEAFERFIGNDAPAYVPKPVLSTADVVRFIHDAGGIAVIAHPGKLKSLDYLDDFIHLGIDGLEVWHPDHNEEMRLKLTEFCHQNALLKTGGSDFHGEDESSVYFGGVPVSDSILQDVQKIWDDYKCRFKQSL
jgi:predicted metal-dependent phosphoesterase TrpH